jgi:quinol monooxygenase YgiN
MFPPSMSTADCRHSTWMKTGLPSEKWESLEALHAHLRAPHMLTYREQVKDMVEDLSLNVLEEA